ncbi:MAG: S8 family serine peptidase [Anaeroplasmataceae bacterium]|nr:S8 family serine peptidase [Anaeroplasmataceae bacterium]
MLKNTFKPLSILFLITIVFMVLFNFSLNAQASSEEKEEDYEPNTVLVTLTNEQSLKFETYTIENFSEIDCMDIKDLSEGSTARMKQQINESKTMTSDYLRINPDNYHHQYKLTFPEYLNVDEVIQILVEREDILSASPNYYMVMEENESVVETNQALSLYSNIGVDMWVNDYLADTQWGLDHINICDAWDIAIGSYDIKVGVIDSGIFRHEDLDSRISKTLNKKFSKDDPCYDKAHHGTSVAGIIGAECNNEIGIAGVCHAVTLVSLKVLDQDGDGWGWERIILAIDYAIEKNIPILNMSQGLTKLTTRQIDDYEKKIKEYPGLVVCAAGKKGWEMDLDGNAVYPACFNLDNLITVGACNAFDERITNSDYSKQFVDIFAPGENIMSTYDTTSNSNTTKYLSRQGTSFAAPFVTGVAALLLSYNSSFTAKDLKDIICAPNLDTYGNKVSSPVKDLCVSGKVLDAGAALALAKEWR